MEVDHVACSKIYIPNKHVCVSFFPCNKASADSGYMGSGVGASTNLSSTGVCLLFLLRYELRFYSYI